MLIFANLLLLGLLGSRWEKDLAEAETSGIVPDECVKIHHDQKHAKPLNNLPVTQLNVEKHKTRLQETYRNDIMVLAPIGARQRED